MVIETINDTKNTFVGFERLFDQYYDKIYVFIARRVNNQHDAEDLTSDVFFKAFANPYNPQLAKFSTYIYTIASNALKNYYRATTNRKADIGSEPSENLADDTDLLAALLSSEASAALKDALTALPERQYQVVYRRYYLDESYREIGMALDTSEANARKIHFEAMQKLKKCLEKPERNRISRV